jgi:hypothetical protein
MPTETQAECHHRLACQPDEDIEDCKRRLRAGGAATDDKDGDGKKDDDKDDDDRDRDRDDDDDDDDDRDRDRDDADRDRDRDDDDARGRREREEQERERRERGDDDDDDDDGGGGGGSDVLRPGTHPGFFSGGFGPSFNVCYRSNCDLVGDRTQFYGTLDFGWHLLGEGFEGPALGANFHGGFGRVAGFDNGRLGWAFKFWWDIQLADDLGFYLTPFAQAGMTSFFWDARPRASDAEHFFNLQIGMMGRLILGDRGMVYVQPVTFDTIYNGDGMGLLYHLELGGGVTFGD